MQKKIILGMSFILSIYTVGTINSYWNLYQLMGNDNTNINQVELAKKLNTETSINSPKINQNDSETTDKPETKQEISKPISRISKLQHAIKQKDKELKSLDYPKAIDYLKPESQEFQKILNLLVEKEKLRTEILNIKLNKINNFIEKEST